MQLYPEISPAAGALETGHVIEHKKRVFTFPAVMKSLGITKAGADKQPQQAHMWFYKGL